MKITVVCIFYLFFVNLSTVLAQNNAVQQAIDNFKTHESLENAGISFMAFDLDSNQILGSLNPKTAMPPASTVKLFTTAAAFEILGKDYKAKTIIYTVGEIDSLGTLNGNIVIRGLGDPSLGSRYFNEKEEANDFLDAWVEAVQKNGIKKINGSVIADGSAFGYHGAPDGWSWSDMGNYYGSGASGCAVYDNMAYLHFSTSSLLDGPTKLDSMTPKIPGFKLHNQVTTYASSRDNAYIYGTPYSYERFAIGNLPRNKSNFEVKASVPDPELLLAQSLEKALEDTGVFVEKSPIGMRKILQEHPDSTLNYGTFNRILTHEGKSVEDIAFWTNMRSVNFFAEQLYCLSTYQSTGFGGSQESEDFMNNYWESRLGVKMYQTDGSGLSRTNAFSANHYIQLLKYMLNAKSFEAFEATLPVAGKSGTLRSVCRGQAAQGRLKAKSGTMNRIKSYSGYVDSRSGRKIAFALIVNNDNLSNYQLVKRMEKVFNAMAVY
ncbi:D-alanyl-D-alanine carboxypeptidase/D-alanyl-D-alanine endopeptidase [Brumimicrobium aurantiacum]|uniref:D-alanyl-D-alanine carboxypeptidase/D-alanyl-D-alanine-endopeptidase n=1 Tax=Brumimicrobium aurantiacum TaxID=1737063 RepID=A0A3E1F1C1_9FLAO|nr:D-alanyl-D-alanine carboxypeptidase/D-alanyl-D-alanine-endopeptidase [Brumimicrobium aurantiacum]RFC55527.1 D-alanyl-D-alanine carboxypeptidase/D-alanyl-D-alanine-endopeptidase [Brumimicrobium aurantiacum]